MHRTDFQVLAALGPSPRGAAEILADIEVMSAGTKPPVATLYRALNRGVEAGWVEIDEPLPPAGLGRPTQQYRLTASGRDAALREAECISRLAEAARNRILSGPV